jgi:RNA polymerase sigma-70 factor (ECF subfamily)
MEGDQPYQAGNEADFGRLYQASYGRILATLTGVLRDRAAAEDCTQETYVRAFRAWHRWNPEAPVEAWLHRIALNVALSYRRRLAVADRVSRLLGRPAAVDDPAAQAEWTDMLAALHRLPMLHAATIVLRHHHGYSNREIAVALGIPESTVASRLAAAKKRLAGELTLADVVKSPIPGVVIDEAAAIETIPEG